MQEAHHSSPRVMAKEIETPFYDILNNNIFNVIVLTIAEFWGGSVFGVGMFEYWLVSIITNAVNDSLTKDWFPTG